MGSVNQQVSEMDGIFSFHRGGRREMHSRAGAWFLFGLFLFCCPFFLTGQAIPCDGSTFLFTTASGVGNSEMHQIQIDPHSQQLTSKQVKADLGYRIAASGYSTSDGYIYALEETTLEVLRIDASGGVVNLGFPNGLNKDHLYSAGAVTPDGRRFFVIGKERATGYDETLFSIAIGHSSRLSAGKVSILNDFNSSVEDMAFDPLRGILYGYDKTSNKLVRIDWFSGQVTNFFAQTMRSVGQLGGLFFDRKGQLYGFGASKGSGEESLLFSVDKKNGNDTKTGQLNPRGKSSEACGCPYTMRVLKEAFPPRVLSCTEMILRYEIVNHAGQAYSYTGLRDTLPEGFIISEFLDRPALARVESGEGSNILALSGFDLLLDTTRIVIKVEVGEGIPPGLYSSQAQLSAFPAAVGEHIFSDDPLSTVQPDATVIEVIGNENIDLQMDIRPTCDGDGATVQVGIPDARYRWSSGDTTQSIFVTQTGTYFVTVSTGCATYEDSISVDAFPQPLTTDLGEDVVLEAGKSKSLDPHHSSGTDDLQYIWSVSGDVGSLSCTDCPSVLVRPLKNTIYTLTITDRFGCMAKDSVFFEVVPVEKIYVPNAFSPDGDGNNDVFHIQGEPGSATIKWLRVLDRWGSLVFEQLDGILNDPAYGWNGRLAGQLASNGVYIWAAELEFADGRRKVLKGDVMLLGQ